MSCDNELLKLLYGFDIITQFIFESLTERFEILKNVPNENGDVSLVHFFIHNKLFFNLIVCQKQYRINMIFNKNYFRPSLITILFLDKIKTFKKRYSDKIISTN